jgi:NTP pyrophosphatase (non-canonical NTP hydrolase)
MKKEFTDILAIARENVERNPNNTSVDTETLVRKYLDGLADEILEVRDEVKEKNDVHLIDELSDIAWNYATLLMALENRGLIPSAEEVLLHAYTKYTERTPAFLIGSMDLWNDVKTKQKLALERRHQEKYGN